MSEKFEPVKVEKAPGEEYLGFKIDFKKLSDLAKDNFRLRQMLRAQKGNIQKRLDTKKAKAFSEHLDWKIDTKGRLKDYKNALEKIAKEENQLIRNAIKGIDKVKKAHPQYFELFWKPSGKEEKDNLENNVNKMFGTILEGKIKGQVNDKMNGLVALARNRRRRAKQFKY